MTTDTASPRRRAALPAPTTFPVPADNGTAPTLPEPRIAPVVVAQQPPAKKPPRIPAPIDPETRVMRRIESLLLELAESDPTAPLRVLDYLAERRRSRATFAPLKPEYPHAGP